MRTYTIVLEVESIDLEDLTTETHGFADREFCIGDQQYLPLLDTSRLPSVTTAIFEEGRTGGTTATASSKLRLVRQVHGRDRLAFLEDREIAGRPARLIAVGILPDGQVYDYATPFVIADGEVGPQPLLATTHLDLEIRRRANVLEGKVPSEVFSGLGEALLFDGVDDSVTTPLLFQPAEGTAMGWAFVPREYVGSTTQILASNGSLTIALGNYVHGATPLVVRHQSNKGVFATVAGPILPAMEQLYFWAIRWTAAGELSIWLDRERVDASGVVIHDVGASWVLGATIGGQSRFQGIGAGWGFFKAALSDAQVEEYRVSSPLGTEDGLVAYYAGESDSGTLFDLARVNNPPIDATVNGALAVNLLEGGEGLRGNLKRRLYGWAENVLATAVDPTRLIYQFGGSVQSFRDVFDRQSPFEIEAVHESLIAFFEQPPTADGMVTVYPPLSLARFHSLPDSAVITADLFGESLWVMSRVLEPDGWLSWGTSLNGFFEDSFTWEFAAHIPVEGEQTLFACDTWNLIYTDLSIEFDRIGWVIQLGIVVNTPSGPEPILGVYAKVEAGASHVCSLVVDESGGYVTVSLYLDGQLQANNSQQGTLYAPTSNFQAGRALFFPFREAQGVHLSEMRLWPTTRTQDQIRATLLEPGPLPSVAGLWRGREDQTTSIVDEVGGNDAQIMGSAGRDAPGVYASGAVEIGTALMRDLGGIASGDLGLAAAHEIDASPQSLLLDSSVELRQALASVLDGLNAGAYVSETGEIVIRQMIDPETAPLDGEIHEHEINDIEELAYARPAAVWEVGYRPVWHVQDGDAVAQGADAERITLVGSPRRYVEACEPANEVRYPSADPRQSVDSNLRFASAARSEAERQKALRRDRRRPYKIKLIQGLSPYRPGGVYLVHHRKLPGGSKRLLVLSKTDNIRNASLKAWG